MTPYSVNAVEFEAYWKLDEMAMLQRQVQVLAEVIYRLEHQRTPPRSRSKDGSLRSYKRLYHQLHIRNAVNSTCTYTVYTQKKINTSRGGFLYWDRR